MVVVAVQALNNAKIARTNNIVRVDGIFLFRTSKSSHNCPRARLRLWDESGMVMTERTRGGAGVESDVLFDVLFDFGWCPVTRVSSRAIDHSGAM